MHARSVIAGLYVTVCSVLAAAAPPASAAALSVTVSTSGGAALRDAVIVAEPLQKPPRPKGGLTAIMDQRDLQFVPDVLVVQTGTAVNFPNSDQVRHQVYSFSPAKTFQLSLYAGHAYPPVIFDKPGLVKLGCNIHDDMLGYIYVTDSPWFGRTDASGALQLTDLPAGEYRIHLWHPLMNEAKTEIVQPVTVGEDSAANRAHLSLSHAMRAPAVRHDADKTWSDY
ncbi:MAG TPA: methylamine utilization protein [Steroidobacteraceae bacterium]